MKEGDTLFETGIGKLDNEWLWRARGHELEKFCRAHEPDWLPLDVDGWLSVGPYKTDVLPSATLKTSRTISRNFYRKRFPAWKSKKLSTLAH